MEENEEKGEISLVDMDRAEVVSEHNCFEGFVDEVNVLLRGWSEEEVSCVSFSASLCIDEELKILVSMKYRSIEHIVTGFNPAVTIKCC